MRIAAVADIHFSPPAYDRIRASMERVRDEADLLIVAGDLTNYGRVPRGLCTSAHLGRSQQPLSDCYP